MKMLKILKVLLALAAGLSLVAQTAFANDFVDSKTIVTVNDEAETVNAIFQNSYTGYLHVLTDNYEIKFTPTLYRVAYQEGLEYKGVFLDRLTGTDGYYYCQYEGYNSFIVNEISYNDLGNLQSVDLEADLICYTYELREGDNYIQWHTDPVTLTVKHDLDYSKFEEITNDLEEVSSDLNQCNDTVSTLEAVNDSLKEEKTVLQTTLVKEKETLNTTNYIVNQDAETIERLNKKIRKLARKNTRLRKKIQGLKK